MAILQTEAGEVRVVRGLGVGDIPAIIEAIKAIADIVKQCRENRAQGMSWGKIKEEARDTSGAVLNRVHRRLGRRLGAARVKALGGKQFTQYLIDRYRTRKAAELEPIIAEATA